MADDAQTILTLIDGTGTARPFAATSGSSAVSHMASARRALQGSGSTATYGWQDGVGTEAPPQT